MGAMWHFYGCQDYPASIPSVCSFKVQTPEQLDFIVRSGKFLDLQFYYNRPTELENLKYVDFLKTYNISSTLPRFYQNNTNPEVEKIGNVLLVFYILNGIFDLKKNKKMMFVILRCFIKIKVFFIQIIHHFFCCKYFEYLILRKNIPIFLTSKSFVLDK
jgi:hypothetical protein